MTGAFLRFMRDGMWMNIEVEYLTNDERKAALEGRSAEELLRWLNLVCHTLAESGREP